MGKEEQKLANNLTCESYKIVTGIVRDGIFQKDGRNGKAIW